VSDGGLDIAASKMERRDWFAALALMGMIVAQLGDGSKATWKVEDLAEDAFLFADAMVKARKRKE